MLTWVIFILEISFYDFQHQISQLQLIGKFQNSVWGTIILTRVGICRFQQRTAQVENWQCKVVWQGKVHSFHFCFAQYTYFLQLFVGAFLCCCGGNGPTLCMSHEKPNPNLNENLNLMWCLLVVHEFCWNFNMLFISMVSNSFAKLFEINQSLLNCC